MFPYLKPNAQKTEMFWGKKTFAPLFLHNNATFSPMPFQKFDGRPALVMIPRQSVQSQGYAVYPPICRLVSCLCLVSCSRATWIIWVLKSLARIIFFWSRPPQMLAWTIFMDLDSFFLRSSVSWCIWWSRRVYARPVALFDFRRGLEPHVRREWLPVAKGGPGRGSGPGVPHAW